VCVRFSHEEYEQLRQVCHSTNTRTLSDLARTAIEHWLASGTGEDSNKQHRKVVELEERLSGLAALVESLTKARDGR
jgi:hypothetical protein